MIDSRPALDPRRTVVGQYTRQLIRYLPITDPDDEFVAWYLHARGLLRPRRFFADVRARNLTEKASRFPARIFQPASYRLGVPRVEWLVDFDLCVATNFLAPATDHRDRVVPVVHDLAFQHFPESAPHIDERWRRRFAATLAEAPAIIVPSTSAAQDLRESFGVAGARIHVVHHGVDAEAFAPVSDATLDAVRRRFGIPGPYVLFVGGIEPRKNLEHLVRAFAMSDSGHLSLVLAGGPVRWYPEASERLDAVIQLLPESVRARIMRTDYVSERDKLALLSGATVLAYPSIYEGFGFPCWKRSRRACRPDIQRVLARRGGRRGRGSGGSGGRRCDRLALSSWWPTKTSARCSRLPASHGVAVHLGGDGARDRGRVAEAASVTASEEGPAHVHGRLQRSGPSARSHHDFRYQRPRHGRRRLHRLHLVDALLERPRRRSRCSTVCRRAAAGEPEAHDGDPRLRFVLGDVADADLVDRSVADAHG